MASKAQPKTIADFRAAHDTDVIVPAKIKTALAQMLAEGTEQWEYEGEFTRRAGVSQTHIARYRAQFEEYIVEARIVGSSKSSKRVWFASPKVAAKVRGTA